jgi:hypothetical protein
MGSGANSGFCPGALKIEAKKRIREKRFIDIVDVGTS